MSNNNFSFIDHPDAISDTTRFWFIRHAIVNEKDRSYLYGTNDVPICPTHLKKQQTYYQFLANKLPKTQLWFITSLSRTRDTALQIQKAGYGSENLQVENAFLEQNLGAWQGLSHVTVEKHRKFSAHPFWPFSAEETPPKGENMNDVHQRVSCKMEEFSRIYTNKDIIVISHGGAIRAALAYASKIPVNSALSFAIYNLSITLIEKTREHWHIITVNDMI